ncbi:MAG: hypothetical protein RL516_52 [Bacteroidota bacterium]
MSNQFLNSLSQYNSYFCDSLRRRVRVVEGARLESVYTPKGYREFESRRLRQISISQFFCFFMTDIAKFI